jgi:flagellar basal-body rod modification protein FlgD
MSDVSAVSQLPTASNPDYADELSSLAGYTTTHKTTLDQSDFLKLLATQLANQDPLSPQDDTESVAQMATFSSIEQSSELVKSLKAFMAGQGLSSAQGMLGKDVTVTTTQTVENADGTNKTETSETSGLVTAIGYDDAGAAVVTIDGKTYPQSSVTEIRNSTTASTTAS